MRVKVGLTVITVSVWLLLASQAQAHNPVASAEMRIDWTSFSVTTFGNAAGPPPAISWLNLSSTVNGYNPDADAVPDWSSNLALQVTGLGSFSRSGVSSTELHS